VRMQRPEPSGRGDGEHEREHDARDPEPRTSTRVDSFDGNVALVASVGPMAVTPPEDPGAASASAMARAKCAQGT
jgi:hypothetical protein